MDIDTQDRAGNPPDRRDWLAALLLRRPEGFLTRFAAGAARWRMLSRHTRRRLQRRVALSAAGAALILAMAGSPLLVPSARAATITVDETTCTLVDAITAANTNTATGGCIAGDPGLDTIDLQADVTLTAAYGTYNFSDTGLPAVTSEIVIEGNGFIIERDGTAPEFRIFYANNADLTLNDVTISGGSSDFTGGAIHFESGSLAIYDSTISDNDASNDGGGIFTDGAVALTIDNSTFHDNTAGLDAGAIYQNHVDSVATITGSTFANNSATNGEGGAIYVDEGEFNISDSVITGNTATSRGGGIFAFFGNVDLTIERTLIGENDAEDGGGIYFLNGSATIVDSTLSGNDAVDSGGGIYIRDGTITLTGVTLVENSAARGGGIDALLATVDVTNSTISGNFTTSADGGGILNRYADVTLTNATITDNYAVTDGGGVVHPLSGSGETIFIRTIVSGNHSGGGDSDEIGIYGGTTTANDHNIFSHAGQNNSQAFAYFVPGASDLDASIDAGNVALAAILDTTLADNGGPTAGVNSEPLLTHDLVADSPAVDLAPDADCVAAPTAAIDQRGAPRPFDVVGQGNEVTDTCDAGAVEYGSPVPGGAVVYVSTTAAGVTDDDVHFGSEDILRWINGDWSVVFDGSAAGLTPNGNAKHNINAFAFLPTDGTIFSFTQNARVVPGIVPKVDGMDLVYWDGSTFGLWFDGSDVGLTNKTAEKIDGLHVLPGSESPIGGGSCLSYLLVSTQGTGRVPSGFGGPQIRFGGEDVLGFCLTNAGSSTAGFWHMALDGSAQGMPVNSTDSISFSDDGQTLYLTTRGTFNVDAAAGGHSMVYKYDFGTNDFSGPFFIAADEGLAQKVDGLQVEGDLP